MVSALNTFKTDALRRFASGRRVSRALTKTLLHEGFIARDEYGSLILTTKGSEALQNA
ncbi:hypothetical protein CDUR_03500 [Corynebacterium durum]|nr:putative transcriptional regulator [Corynebacterium durum]WJY84455.1 hypothetical protein CDUR_03500 [Corynebacterium durum]